MKKREGQVFNVWGAGLKDREIVSHRAMQALADNPKVKDLHIAITVQTQTHPITQFQRQVTFYRAMWWDATVARKQATARREARAYAKAHPYTPKHDCPCCDC